MLFGLAIGLLTFASSAWAEGPIVRWDRIEGVLPPPGSPMVIGDQANKIQSHQTMWTAGKGRAMINLETGFVSFQVEGLVFSDAMTTSPIGSSGSSLTVMGTVVCNAGMHPSPWVIEFADTTEVVMEFGTASFSGFVAIPPMCLQDPNGIAFLIRRPPNVLKCPNCFIAFGAGRTVQ
jgi:hypothetical protein